MVFKPSLLEIFNHLDLIEFDDHRKACNFSVKKGSNLKGPIETVKGTAEIEILESFLAKESEAEDPECDGSVPPFFVRLVDFQSFLEFNSILDNWSG